TTTMEKNLISHSIGNHVSATIIADSINQYGNRITTFQLKFPRIILPEVNTHRVMSKNAASTRAIPTKKAIDRLLNGGEMFKFAKVGKNQSGMQAYEEVSSEIAEKFHSEWEELCKIVCGYVSRWDSEYQIHKQVISRALEPWTYSQMVLTATDFDNFEELRIHHAAEPHINDLAICMREARSKSVPVKRVSINDWHLPYVTDEERQNNPIEDLLAFSTARCARVSYLLHDGSTTNPEKDRALHEQLVGSNPKHSSPSEHQAYPNPINERVKNFQGWVQYRAIIESNTYANI
ncbi:MAG TPA: hypothetical protein VFM18_14750, partial [Methanosarcina sp.]|nr:hypothetical protein [Methanosarcina sp.]